MRDYAARGRSGVPEAPHTQEATDTRIHVDQTHLMSLEGQARRMTLLPRQPAHSILNGRHASRLRGRGLNFEELRGYLPGDDSRTIDWKVTARTGKPHVRVYTEERDRPTLLVVDQRMAMYFGTQLNMKSVTAAEAATIAAFTTLNQGDRIGCILFDDNELVELRPLQSRSNIDRMVDAMARMNCAMNPNVIPGDPMPLNKPLEAAARIAKSNHLVMVVSDFDDIDDQTEQLLTGIAQHNDLLLFLVTDPVAHSLAEDWNVVISDGELQSLLNTTDPVKRAAIAEFTEERLAYIHGWQERLGVPVLPLSAGQPTLPQIQALLGYRQQP
ncbi:MAG: DUF58 domain-containing protein [Candidatus Pelagadaptatus aseana]|uniref:DUF58 domain-containing protein n=1 Tax=Candidatus Pelagadaptatus aseana TaxID=3120508 RepID=UPI0039B25ACE